MSQNYSCIIIDDEQDAIDLLSDRIEQLFHNIDVVATFTHWKQALPVLRENEFDILFLDVSMPEKSGFEILKLVPGMGAEIIFVTAHDNFALKAFSFAATGYILKPIDDSDLANAIDKALERVKLKSMLKRGSTSAATSGTPSQSGNGKIKIPSGTGIDYVNINDVIYLESTNKCTMIVTNKGKYTSSANIGTFRYLIDDHAFFQVHRSFIVNLNKVMRYELTGFVVMEDKTEVPIARNIRQEFLQLFDK